MTRQSGHSAQKGQLLEDVVAELFADSELQVECRKFLPVVNSPSETAQIDVLLTGKVAGLAGWKVQFAIECKNHRKPVGVGIVREFARKLKDVGIPRQHGILVSINGYSREALAAARRFGVRTLVLEGLTADRLAAEVREAVQSVTYLLAEIIKISIITPKSVSVAAWDDDEQAAWLLQHKDEAGGIAFGGPLDLAWAKWRDGQIPYELGEHQVELDLPRSWRWIKDGPEDLVTATATVQVLGVVVSVEGQSEIFHLRDASSNAFERLRVNSTFELGSNTHPVQVARTEAELEAIQSALPGRQPSVRLTTGRILLPRVRYKVYWPPSDVALARVAQAGHYLIRNGRDLSELANLTSREIDGIGLEHVWEPINRTHPAAKIPDWPYGPRTP